MGGSDFGLGLHVALSSGCSATAEKLIDLEVEVVLFGEIGAISYLLMRLLEDHPSVHHIHPFPHLAVQLYHCLLATLSPSSTRRSLFLAQLADDGIAVDVRLHHEINLSVEVAILLTLPLELGYGAVFGPKFEVPRNRRLLLLLIC